MTDATALTTDSAIRLTVDRLESSVRGLEDGLWKLRRDVDQKFRDAEDRARMRRNDELQTKVNWFLVACLVAVTAVVTYSITHAALT